TLYIYRAYKMEFFENYFHLIQQMPTTSGFRDDFFLLITTLSWLSTITLHLSILSFQYYSSL
ncbi:MAG TPA: hypothetical protein PLH63_03380, partial [Candidatus Cloacimonadota bacterium]|nr:hypothetical protein [Candidatus Cloacimonadota bacterium]